MVKLSKKLISVIIILSFILESSGSSFFFHAKDASDKSALRPLSVFNFQKKTLAELEEKCKACESLMAGVYMSEVATLDNAYIIDTGASPGGKQYPVPIKVVNDSKSPMRRNIVYAETWGQAVLVPVDMGIDIYADRAKDCPKLIMRLKDKDGRAYILLEHVRSDNIDTEIINLVGHLEKMNMSAQEIAFYPRDDSERKVADSVLNSYLGRQIKIKVRDGDSKDESTARTLVTDKGYIVMSDSNNHIIDSGLWADGGAGIETALEEAPVSSPSAAKAHVAEKSGRKEGDGISKQLQALGNPIFFIDRKSPKGAIRTNDEVVSALARHGFKKAGVLDNDDYGYLLVFEDKRGKEYVLRSAAGVETTVYYLARVLGFEDINGVSIFILDRAGAGQEAFALMEFYDGETFSTRKLGGPGFDSELYRKNPKLRDLTLKGLDLHAWMKMLADPAQIVRSDLFNILIGDFDADEPNNLMYRKPETKGKKVKIRFIDHELAFTEHLTKELRKKIIKHLRKNRHYYRRFCPQLLADIAGLTDEDIEKIVRWVYRDELLAVKVGIENPEEIIDRIKAHRDIIRKALSKQIEKARSLSVVSPSAAKITGQLEAGQPFNNPNLYGLATTDPHTHNWIDYSYLLHAGVGMFERLPDGNYKGNNPAHLDRLFDDINYANKLVFCTFWNTPKHRAFITGANLIIEPTDKSKVVWTGMQSWRKDRPFWPLRWSEEQVARELELLEMVMESRDPPDLSSYPQDIAEGSGDYCAMEIDIRGAKVVGVYLSLLPLDEFKGIDSEFTALALKYNLPIILEKTDQLIDPRAFFEGLINDKDFVETLRRRGIYTDDYKERARKLVVTPEGATASPSAAKINSQPQIGEVEAEVMASLHGAEEFREAVFDLYEEYRFPTPKEKSPTRHKHTGNVTETALLIARIYGLSDYWMRILWKAALLHDVGQARAVDYGLCKDIRTFAMAHKIPHKTQLAIRELERNRREVTDAVIADMPQEFFRRIKEAGFDMSLYGKEREKRVERACKALLHESYSRQILRERINSLHIEVEEEVEWIVGYHSYPEVLPLNINPMIKTVTEILHAADAINARNDAERNIFYGRPVDFEHALAHGEQFIINAYRAGIFSFEVLQATARVVRGYRDEFRRIIMSTRCLPENTPWPEYDVKYRSTPLEIILAQAEPNAVALAPRLLSEIERYKRNFAKLYGKDNIGTNDIQVMLFLDYDDSGNIISSYTSSRLVETQDSSVMKISHDGLARQFGLYNKGYCAILFVFKIINGKYDIIEAIPTINRLLIPATKRNIYIKTVKLAVEILEKLGYPREVIDGVSFYPSSTLLGEAETRSLVDKRGGDINEVTIYDVAELTEMPLNQTLQTDEPAPLKPPSQHSDIAILQSA